MNVWGILTGEGVLANFNGKQANMCRFSRQMMALVISILILGPASPAWPAVTHQQVQDAIDKAKAYLYAQQKDGNWESTPAPDPAKGVDQLDGGQWGTRTALATLALAYAGAIRADQQVNAGMQFSVAADLKGIYAMGLRAQLLVFSDPGWEKRVAERTQVRLLLKALGQSGDQKGFYAYAASDDSYHYSPSQFGVQGMWALSRGGMVVPITYWQTVDTAWRRTQRADGGWPVALKSDKAVSSPSTTAAGLATLLITKAVLSANAPTDCDVAPVPDEAIEKGLKYLGEHIKDVDSLSAWNDIVIIAVADGRREFGGIDWFQLATTMMLKQQRPDGSMVGNSPGEDDPVVATSFMLLFLNHGNDWLLMQKLQYKADDPPNSPSGSGNLLWNQRPRDAASFARWLGGELCAEQLVWQSVDISESVDVLHNAPILYIAGSTRPRLTDGDKAKLRQYVEEGGMIIGNANADKSAFKQWFIALGAELFPGYEFRDLPAQHPIFVREVFRFAEGETHTGAFGISNGVRELMVLLDGDPAAVWQTQIKDATQPAFKNAGNVCIYARGGSMENNLLRRGQTYRAPPAAAGQPASQLKMAHIQYQGNWNPEPASWKRLAAIMVNSGKLKLDIDTVELGKGHLSGYKFARLTGTAAVKFRPAELDALKAYVNGGGTLLIDAAGGSDDFATAMHDQLHTLFATELAGQQDIPTLDKTDPLYTADGNVKVQYRPFARHVGKYPSYHEPHLRAITVNNRNAIYFSDEDLSAGLVGAPADGINGYEPESAVELTSRIVMSVVNGSAGPAK